MLHWNNPGPQGRILLVEDQAEVRESLADVLEAEGYTVTTAGDGVEALETLKHGTLPDVILLDLMMPRMNGWDFAVAKDIDADLAPIPLILISGLDHVEHEAQPLAATEVLQKPFELDYLLDIIHGYCSEPQRAAA